MSDSVANVVPMDNHLGHFLHFLYGDSEGYVYSPVKKLAEDGTQIAFERNYFPWPQDVRGLLNHIRTAQGEVYLAPALFARPSGMQNDFKLSTVVWAEFDGNTPNPNDLGDIPKPSVRIRSSEDGHEHWYWKLDEPVTDKEKINNTNRALAYILKADTSGWDANQILRPPDTTNHKRGKAVSLVHFQPGLVSSIGEFAGYEAPARVNDEILNGTIPDVQDVSFKYPWPSSALTLFRSTPATGDRSSALTALAYHCAEMGMTNEEMCSVLLNADDRWGKFRDRDDRKRRIVDLITVARVKYPSYSAEGDTFALYGFRSLLESTINIEWVVPGILQKQGYMLLTGASGVGKTQFTLRFAIAIALGRPFLHYGNSSPRKVLFFSLEMGHADLKYFIETMAENLSTEDIDLLEENLIFIPLGEPLALDSQAVQLVVEGIIGNVAPVVVFFDSAGSAASGELASETVVKSLMLWNDRVRKQYDIATWFIHHQRKANADNKKPTKLEDVYGNQYLVNRATSVYCMWRDTDTPSIEVYSLKQRLSEKEDTYHVTRTPQLDFEPYQMILLDSKQPISQLSGEWDI